jgi:hypothetical protein
MCWAPRGSIGAVAPFHGTHMPHRIWAVILLGLGASIFAMARQMSEKNRKLAPLSEELRPLLEEVVRKRNRELAALVLSGEFGRLNAKDYTIRSSNRRSRTRSSNE